MSTSVKFNTVVVFLLLSSLALSPVITLAQEAQIELKFVGYGKSLQEIYISIGNTGKITISDVTIYIDDKAYKTIEGASGPGMTFEEVLFLEEGKHTIEARTPEGAYASLEVTASIGEVSKPTVESEKPNILDSIKENILWIVLGIAILVFAVSIWFIRKGRFTRKE